MKRFQIAIACGVMFAFAAAPVQAFFHQWDFSEVFSNDDGTVQFIEMTTSANTETVAVGIATMTIQSTTNNKTFTFNHNLGPNSANKRILIATSGFESSPGLPTTPPLLTPDYTLAANFMSSTGDTIRFCQNGCTGFGILKTRTFASLPTDGVTSLEFLPAVATAPNSPRNYFGTTGSVDLTPPPPTPTGDYNGDHTVNAADYTFWRDALGTAVAPFGSGADGHADGMIDDLDFDFWKQNFGTPVPGSGSGGVATIVPEPAVLTLALLGLWALILATARVRSTRAGE